MRSLISFIFTPLCLLLPQCTHHAAELTFAPMPSYSFSTNAPSYYTGAPLSYNSPAYMTEDSAIQYALQRDTRLAIVRAQVYAIHHQWRDALRPNDPELRAGYDRTWRRLDRSDRTSHDNQNVYELGLRFFPSNPWERYADMRQAHAEVEAALSAITVEEQRIAQEIRELYLVIRHANAELSLLTNLEEIRQEKRAHITRKMDEGIATEAEALNASAAWLETSTTLREKERERNAALRRLAQRTGIASLTVEPSPLENDNVPEPRVEMALFTTNSHPEIARMHWQLVAANASIRRAHLSRYPWFSHIQVAMDYDQHPRNNLGVSVQTAILLPLFANIYPEQRYREATRDVVSAQLEDLRETVTDETLLAWDEWHEAVEVYQEMTMTYQPVMYDMYRLIRRLEEREDVDSLHLIRMKELLYTTRHSLVRAWARAERARVNYCGAAGIILSSSSMAGNVAGDASR